MTELVVEALFALVFVRVLVAYARHRDPLQADVATMFAAMAVIFVLALLRKLVGEPPAVVASVASALLLGQPFLTMRLVRRVANVPAGLYWGALGGWLASAAAMLAAGESTLPDWALLMVVAVFVVSEVAAAVLLTRLARQRRGAPRTRLAAAAVATALFAAAIAVAGAGAGREDAGAWQDATRIIALASALAYLLAFMPPAWLRRSWSQRAAAAVVSDLVRIPADATPEVIWQRYTDSVREATGSDGAVVLCNTDDGLRELARKAVPAQQESLHSLDGSELLAHGSATNLSVDGPVRAPAAAVAYARAVDARFLTVVPLAQRLSAGFGVLLLFNRHRSLFTDDDVHLLGEVSGQAAALAQRAELLSDRDRLTGELTETVAALTAAGKAKSDFMANMSH
ncbi:MAG TPA: GAF domain-containing protein, partial [Actinoplanes sp.]|nr:GAF domain-containing protein [Actinoplanes sp.]